LLSRCRHRHSRRNRLPRVRRKSRRHWRRTFAFIRANLLIADALVKERDWTDARPHGEYPREEVCSVIREDLRTRKVAAFDGTLRELS
jgi:hypothetical protein